MLDLNSEVLDVVIASGSTSEKNLAIALILRLWLIEKYLRTPKGEPLFIKMDVAMSFDQLGNWIQ